jgi:hypothetical protein
MDTSVLDHGDNLGTMCQSGGYPRHRHRHRRKTLLAGGLTLAILAACSSTPSPVGSSGASSPTPTQGAQALTQADVQRVVDDLAGLGIETRVRPSDSAPITAVTGARSAVRLLRLQVRNLALERVGGGGTMGADLDALGAAAGGGPVSPLLARWAASSTTPGAQLAASLLRHNDPLDAVTTVFPTLAVVAFIADVNAGSAGASAGNQKALLALSSSDHCAQMSAYLSAALEGITDSKAIPPPWLKQLIDLYAPQYAGDPALLRKTIGALALLSYATSLARPWTVSLQPDPPAVAYGIEGQDPVDGEVDLTVVSGMDVFATDVADCASLAAAQLASIPVEGSSVVWDTSGLGAHATNVAGQSQVDENGVAALTYQTATESKDAADNGSPVTVQLSVSASVDRAEMAALAAVVKAILLGDASGTPAGPATKAIYQALEPALNAVMRPSGSAQIDVAYHQPKSSPSPSHTESELTGTWDGTWAIDPPFAGAIGDFTMKLVQTGGTFSGAVEITNTDCSNGPVNGTVAGTNVTFGWLLTPQPVQFSGVLNGRSMSGTWASIACSNPSISLTGTWKATKRP